MHTVLWKIDSEQACRPVLMSVAERSAHNTPVSEVVFGLICLRLTAVLPTGAPSETANSQKHCTDLLFFPKPQRTELL